MKMVVFAIFSGNDASARVLIMAILLGSISSQFWASFICMRQNPLVFYPLSICFLVVCYRKALAIEIFSPISDALESMKTDFMHAPYAALKIPASPSVIMSFN